MKCTFSPWMHNFMLSFSLLTVLQAKLPQIVIFKEQSAGRSSTGFDSHSCQEVRVHLFCAAEAG